MLIHWYNGNISQKKHNTIKFDHLTWHICYQHGNKTYEDFSLSKKVISHEFTIIIHNQESTHWSSIEGITAWLNAQEHNWSTCENWQKSLYYTLVIWLVSLFDNCLDLSWNTRTSDCKWTAGQSIINRPTRPATKRQAALVPFGRSS